MSKYGKVLACLVCGCVVLSGCGAKAEEDVFQVETEVTVPTFDDADITVPAGLVGDEVSEDKIISVDKDSGDVTYALTGSDRSDIVTGLITEIDDSINVILADKEYYPDVDSISYNNDFTEFTIELENGQANIYESMLSMSFYTVGNKYQIYYGTDSKDALTTVTYTNASTGEVVATGSSSSMATY